MAVYFYMLRHTDFVSNDIHVLVTTETLLEYGVDFGFLNWLLRCIY